MENLKERTNWVSTWAISFSRRTNSLFPQNNSLFCAEQGIEGIVRNALELQSKWTPERGGRKSQKFPVIACSQGNRRAPRSNPVTSAIA